MKISVKIIITVLVTLLCTALLFYSVIGIILLGPSKDASRMLLEKLNESSATEFIPSLYMSKEKQNAIFNSYDNGEFFTPKTVIINFSEEQ